MKGQLLDAIPLTTLHGVGAGQAGKLAGIGLHTLQDLLFHLPLRYEDQTRLYTITNLLRDLCHRQRRSAAHRCGLWPQADDDLPDKRRYRHLNPAFL